MLFILYSTLVAFLLLKVSVSDVFTLLNVRWQQILFTVVGMIWVTNFFKVHMVQWVLQYLRVTFARSLTHDHLFLRAMALVCCLCLLRNVLLSLWQCYRQRRRFWGFWLRNMQVHWDIGLAIPPFRSTSMMRPRETTISKMQHSGNPHTLESLTHVLNVCSDGLVVVSLLPDRIEIDACDDALVTKGAHLLSIALWLVERVASSSHRWLFWNPVRPRSSQEGYNTTVTSVNNSPDSVCSPVIGTAVVGYTRVRITW